MSLSFFQKSCGGGEASTLHSNLTVSPSRALEFNIFWMKVGGRSASWAVDRKEKLRIRWYTEDNSSPSTHVLFQIHCIFFFYLIHRASWWICSLLHDSWPRTHTRRHGAPWRSLWWMSASLSHTPTSYGSHLDVWLCRPGTRRRLGWEGLQPGYKKKDHVLSFLFICLRNLVWLVKLCSHSAKSYQKVSKA